MISVPYILPTSCDAYCDCAILGRPSSPCTSTTFTLLSPLLLYLSPFSSSRTLAISSRVETDTVGAGGHRIDIRIYRALSFRLSAQPSSYLILASWLLSPIHGALPQPSFEGSFTNEMDHPRQQFATRNSCAHLRIPTRTHARALSLSPP